MCGRFTQKADKIEITEQFYIDCFSAAPVISYNIAPGQSAGIILQKEDKITYDVFHWGLIPSWAKDKKISYKTFNARSETVSEKPSFKKAYTCRRCIIPLSGYYEWQQTPDGKIPHYIYLKNKTILPAAGLWEYWDNNSNDIYSFTILTTDAVGQVSALHHRMPVFISKENISAWLNPEKLSSTAEEQIFQNYNQRVKDTFILGFHRVSEKINNIKNNLQSNINLV
jgi:putative SOS response-associated peptidase YedK